MRKLDMKFMKEDDGGSGPAVAIAKAVEEAVADEPKAEPKDDDKLEAKQELFVRRITDSVTKAVADLLNPPKKEEITEDTEDEDAEAPKRKRKAKATSVPTTAPKKRFSIFPGLF